MPNFVKFLRGSQAAYDRLSIKDLDTLYFIYDSTNSEASGKLYLGETLIGGTGSSIGATTLNGLSDVDLTDLADGALLQYDYPANKWIAVQPSEVGISGSSSISVNAGTLADGETIAQAQNRLNNNPSEGDIVIISGNPYIYDGSQWRSLDSADLNDQITGLNTRVGNLETNMLAVDGKIAAAVANAGHLTYQKVQDLQEIEDAISNAGADLTAISNTIYLVPNNGSASNLYDEYMVIDGATEIVGNFQPVLSDYVTTSTFNTTVNNLTDQINSLSTNLNDYLTINRFETEVGNLNDLLTATGKVSTTVIDELIETKEDITNIYEMLEWQPINN